MMACDSPLWLDFSAMELFWAAWMGLTVMRSAIPLFYIMILAPYPSIILHELMMIFGFFGESRESKGSSRDSS